MKFLLHKSLRLFGSNKAIKVGVVGFVFILNCHVSRLCLVCPLWKFPKLSNDPKAYVTFVYLCFLVQSYLNTEKKTFEGFKVKLSCQCYLAILKFKIDRQYLGRRKVNSHGIIALIKNNDQFYPFLFGSRYKFKLTFSPTQKA